MDKNWINVVKWHDRIGRHDFEVPNLQNLQTVDLQAKIVGVVPNSPFCDPTVGVPKLCFGDFFV